jgi:hypothetical protein
MSSAASQSTTGPITFGNVSNESPWLVPALIIGGLLALLGIGWLFTKKGK